MHEFLTAAMTGLLIGLLWPGNVRAQQTPEAKPPATTTKTQPAPVKTGQTTAAKKSTSPLVLKTQKDKFSYALGMNLGANLRQGQESVPLNRPSWRAADAWPEARHF